MKRVIRQAQRTIDKVRGKDKKKAEEREEDERKQREKAERETEKATKRAEDEKRKREEVEKKAREEAEKENRNSDIVKNIIGKHPNAPAEYHGVLKRHNIPASDSRRTHDGTIQAVNKVPGAYKSFTVKQQEPKRFPLSNNSKGDFFCYFYHKEGMDYASPLHVAFYIPGTASSVTNHDIDKSIASHLVNSLNMPVILISHRLAPAVKWPVLLNDVCQAIEELCASYKNSKITLIGYSTGGLFSMLVILLMHKKNIVIEQVFLFAPLLDLGGEFSNLGGENYQNYRSCLPKVLQESDEYFSILRKAKEDPYSKDPAFFHNIILNCFSEEIYDAPGKLRELSPIWLSVQVLREALSKTTLFHFITGEKDLFRVESEILYGNMQAAGLHVRKTILKGETHEFMWKKLYPLYLTQTLPEDKRESVEQELDIGKVDALFLTRSGSDDKETISESQLSELKERCRTALIYGKVDFQAVDAKAIDEDFKGAIDEVLEEKKHRFKITKNSGRVLIECIKGKEEDDRHLERRLRQLERYLKVELEKNTIKGYKLVQDKDVLRIENLNPDKIDQVMDILKAAAEKYWRVAVGGSAGTTFHRHSSYAFTSPSAAPVASALEVSETIVECRLM